MTIEPGQHLLHYRLIEKIGQGGMGVVWCAEDTRLHRQVALKVLPHAMAGDPERLARFEREARVVASLSHPNIVTLHSVEEAETPAGKVRFITMELVAGRTLNRLLPKNGFPLQRVFELGIPLVDAVARAHRAGIIHRDLKPDNIMVDDDGRLRVLDFGLAKLHEPSRERRGAETETVTSHTADGRVVGTASYMSPEQAEGKEVDGRSDVFSLGTILFEMLTGARPFRGDTTMSTIGAILKDDAPELATLQPSLPRHVGRIVRRCLAKDPERRYQTAVDLRNELEGLRSEIESGLHDPDVAAPGPRARRSPAGLVLSAALGLVAGALLTATLWNRGEADPVVLGHRPISATNAWDTGPSWSPDGKFIAFDRMQSGNTDIYIKPIDGGDEVARVEQPGDQAAPRWSPDSRHLAYISNEPGSPVLLVPPDGGAARTLIETNLPALSGNEGDLFGNHPWSADSRSLLVARSEDGRQFAIYRVALDTVEAERVTSPPPGTNDSQASYSFDHRRILFRRGGGIGAFGRIQIMVMPAEGGEAEVLYEAPDIVSLAWRPDNRHAVFLKTRSMFELDLASRRARPLAAWTHRVQNVAVSAEDRIVYADFWHDQFLYTVDVGSGERKQVTSHASNNGASRFAPDGRTIAYASNRRGSPEVWVRHPDDRPETRLGEEGARATQPEWSPDGRRIVFRSDRDGAPKLFVTNIDSAGGDRLLIDQPLRGGMNIGRTPRHRWSPGGELIAYPTAGDGGREMWTVRPDGGDARKRLEDANEFDWYLDDRRGLATRQRGSETVLLAVDLESGAERVLFEGPLREIDVAPDGSAVAFCFGRGHHSMGLALLKLGPPSGPDGLPTAVGEPEYVVPTAGTWHVHLGGWSPDSKRIVYTHDQDYGNLYELTSEGEPPTGN